jgi:hypothetical protein
VAARGVATIVDAVAASAVAARGGASVADLLAATARGGTLATLDGERRPWRKRRETSGGRLGRGSGDPYGFRAWRGTWWGRGGTFSGRGRPSSLEKLDSGFPSGQG